MTATVHPTAIIEAGVEIGAGTTIWDHAHVREGACIGEHCIIGEKTYIAYGVRIADFVKINGNVSVCAGVTIEAGCMVAAHAVFTNDVTPRATDPEITRLRGSAPDEHTLATLVRRGATIGANATIGPGVELGSFCMVGMGAVVTRDVGPFELVIGNPARFAGYVARDGKVVWRGDSPPTDGTRIDCEDGRNLRIDGSLATLSE